MGLAEVESQYAKWKTENNGRRPLPDYEGSRQGRRRSIARDCGEDKHQEAESVLPVRSDTMSRANACST